MIFDAKKSGILKLIVTGRIILLLIFTKVLLELAYEGLFNHTV